MKDTDILVESRFLEMMMERSGQERMKMGFSMFDMARRQVIASIKERNPNAGENDIKKEIFLRFYAQEFSPKEQEKIMNCIVKFRRY